MEFKRFVVLANSYKKKSGRCVAGRELGEGNVAGGWLRPISDQPEGELLPRHMKVDDGEPLEVLDIVDVPIGDYAKDKTHPEDWRVDASVPWKRRKPLAAKHVPSLEETPRDLWSTLQRAMTGQPPISLSNAPSINLSTSFVHRTSVSS